MNYSSVSFYQNRHGGELASILPNNGAKRKEERREEHKHGVLTRTEIPRKIAENDDV